MPGPDRNQLSLFHPLIAQWFQRRVGTPTTVQQKGWASIAAGEHVLITAPTGSGKTLTAFLWAIDRLVDQAWPGGCARVLYISPLKALNNDIQRNLKMPLAELKELFASTGTAFPDIRVQTRSGDTPQRDRRRMLRHPPEILITTPESLNLLLSSAGGRNMLGGITTVILDEIHAVVGNKRGVHLISAVDRLVRLSGEFQRISLSATVKPLETVAQFVGGYAITGSGPSPQYAPRPVSVISGEMTKAYQVRVSFPAAAVDRAPDESVWKPLAEAFKNIIRSNRATLIFTNSRRLCEKLTLKINRGAATTIAYAHHGSLSREIRGEVESRLKAGDLKAIVATNSLELGIDIGDLDEVVLVQSPPSVSSAVQRVGRAGHRIGETSRGTLFPTHAHDFLEAAVLAAAIPEADIEAVAPVRCPLDVLAQIVVSMVGVETWDVDELYAWLKTSYPYRHLSRSHFDLVLNMLAGRYADSRIRELKPRISIDGLDHTVAGRPGALLAVYSSGGVIPDRGYFHLRHQETNGRIGELDEEFVWEASIGQTFTLGTQNWKIARITHNDVFVVPASPKALAAPFWRAEQRRRDFHFSSRLSRFLEEADQRLASPEWAETLKIRHFMDASAAEALTRHLKRQKKHTGCDLPHRHHLVVEFISAGPGRVPGHQVVLHTLWGGRLNHPYALALGAAWEEKYGQKIEVYADNDCISIMLPHEETPEVLLSLVTSARLSPLLQKRLEGSGFFGARFRECAGRALLLTRRKFNERVPLWMSRLRSQKLMEAVDGYHDFPILLETWRTCLQDEFDLANLQRMLDELAAGSIGWSAVRTASPSPMAQGMAWRQINQYMYMGDEPASERKTRLNSDLLKDLVLSPDLRPAIPARIVTDFTHKRQRLSVGYTPSTPRDLLDWTKERILIPDGEWRQLLKAIRRDHEVASAAVLESISDKLVRMVAQGCRETLIGALEILPRTLTALQWPSGTFALHPLSTDDSAQVPGQAAVEQGREHAEEATRWLLGEWLQFYGPVSTEFIGDTLGIAPGRLHPALEDLVDNRKLITGRLVDDGADGDLCDTPNFEILLRMTRSDAAPAVEPLAIDQLQLFLAAYQGIADPRSGDEAIYRVMDQLIGCPLKAKMWEAEVLPARLPSYRTQWLDSVIQESDLMWTGCRNQEVVFCFESDLDLLENEPPPAPRIADADEDKSEGRAYADLFADPAGRYHFTALQRQTGQSAATLARRLWQGAWQGKVSNDSMLALRHGISTQFKPPPGAAQSHPNRHRRGHAGFRAAGRGGFRQWKQSQHLPGNWFLIPQAPPADDPLAQEERNRARIRLLLDRYGLVFRELLLREALPLQWVGLFRSLRIMELSGEVLSGYFFHGIPGLQFISPRALRFLQGRMPKQAVYWFNAADPASVCGLPLDALRGSLPPRRSGTHLVYRGSQLVMVSQGHGKNLAFHVAPDEPDLVRYLGPLHHLLRRVFAPMRSIGVETINEEPAAASPYRDVMKVAFEIVTDYKKITLYRLREDI